METIAIIGLAIITAAFAVMNFYQVIKIQDLEDEISRKEEENESLTESLSKLCHIRPEE